MTNENSTMLKKLLACVGLLIALGILAGGAFVFWLRSDAVRQTIVTQATAAFRTPVRIEMARATVFPRLGVELMNVTIGDPSRARLDRVSIATGFSVIWTRRVEDADVLLRGGSLDGSLVAAIAGRGAFPGSDTSSAPADSESPLSIESIRSIRLRDVTVSAGNERIAVSVDASLAHDRLRLTNGLANVRDATVHIDGELSTRSREGHFNVRSDELPVDTVLGALKSMTASTENRKGVEQIPGAPFRLSATIDAQIAMIGGHRAESFKARLNATPTAIVVDPVTFDLHDGHFEVRVTLDTSRPNAPVQYRGRVSGIDVTRLGTREVAQEKTITGRLGATFAVEAPVDAERQGSGESWLVERARGSMDLDMRDGRMPGIEAVRQAVIRFANRADSAPQPEASDAFSELKASLTLRSGAAALTKLTMKAEDFEITGNGALSLLSWRMALDVDVTLSEALSQQAGRDLYRYARDGRRIVLPATIGGTLFEPTASVDVSRAAGRALQNKVEDELKSFLDRLLRKP
jgi:AsmA-like protein